MHAVVEGQTEESFINELLALELGEHDISMDVHLITTGRKQGRMFRFAEVMPERSHVVAELARIRALVPSPEEIDDGPTTAPSARILRLAPDYEKLAWGLLIAKRIGLATLRRECPHFNGWITNLTSLT